MHPHHCSIGYSATHECAYYKSDESSDIIPKFSADVRTSLHHRSTESMRSNLWHVLVNVNGSGNVRV